MKTSSSSSSSSSPSPSSSKMVFPILYQDEVRPGPTLGEGSFCEVRGVKTIRLNDFLNTIHNDDDNDNTTTKTITIDDNQKGRRRLGRMYAIPYIEQDPLSRPPRLAMKRLKDDLNKRKRKIAMEDFQRELEILRQVRHDNIIELHAVGVDSSTTSTTTFGHGTNVTITTLFLTRIHATLENLLSKWRSQQGFGILPSDPDAEKNLWLERLVLLMRVASAVDCFHSHRILVRDLKPDNIGMDDFGIPKLYDFGLAKRLPDNKLNNQHEHEHADTADKKKDTKLYKLTGQTGTLRYMAPEVALSHPYNATADVHSLGIVVHQVMSLQVPYAGMAPSDFETEVIVGGLRPTIDVSWPRALKEVLSKLWDETPQNRPAASELVTVLETMLRGSDEELYPSSQGRRRSLVSRMLGV